MKANIEFINDTFRIDPEFLELKREFCRKNSGKNGVIEIKGSKRKLEHNNYYWLLISILSDYTGYTETELHEMYCIRVFGKKVITVNGRSEEVRESSSDKDTSRFNELVEHVKSDMVEMGIAIPERTEYNQINKRIGIK